MPSHDPQPAALTPPLARVEGHERAADRRRLAGGLVRPTHSRTRRARRPRLAAGDGARHRCRGAARRRPLATGRPDRPRRRGLVVPHRVRGRAGGRRARRSLLRLDGIATVAEVFLNGEPLLESDSMFAAHALDVGALLRAERQPSWRSAAGRSGRCCGVAASRAPAGARGSSTTACASSARCCSAARPGFAPGPAAVGPWRPVRLERRRRRRARRVSTCAPRLDGGRRACCRCGRALRALGGEACRARSRSSFRGRRADAPRRLELAPGEDGVEASGELVVPAVARWWPHTHGEPALHEVRLRDRAPAGRSASTPAGSASASWRRAPTPATTPRTTASTCTSTASASSPAAPSGRRSTPSASRPGGDGCGRRWSAPATPG